MSHFVWHHMYWMEGLWKYDYNTQPISVVDSQQKIDKMTVIYSKQTSDTYESKNSKEENELKEEKNISEPLCPFNKYETYSSVLPLLETVIIDTILLYMCNTNDLCIQKYVLLDIKTNALTFFIKKIENNKLFKTFTVPINTSNSFTKELLKEIKTKSPRFMYFSIRENHPPQNHMECTVYFHNNYNTLVNGQCFILTIRYESLLEDMPLGDRHWTGRRNEKQLDDEIFCHILCQFINNSEIKILKKIELHCTPTFYAETPSSCYDYGFPQQKGFNIKYDANYIYAAKYNILCVNLHDAKLNKLIPVHFGNELLIKENNIQHYQLYTQNILLSFGDSITENDINAKYMMLSRYDSTKLELYEIKGVNISLYHKFELKSVFDIMNDEYHNKYDPNSRNRSISRMDIILSFDMKYNDLLCCVYYNKGWNRLFFAYIKLSFNNKCPIKLIDYTLLDGSIGKLFSTSFQCYKRCYGIEVMDVGTNKYWLVFCEHYAFDEFMVTSEAEFMINVNDLKVQCGTLRPLHCCLDYHYRKQISESKCMF